MPPTEVNSSHRGSSSFSIGYQLPKPDLFQQVSAPSHYDIFLAYTAETVPIMIGLDKAIREEGFTPWQGDLETLINSPQVEDPYQGIHQSDALVMVLADARVIPLDLKDELDQAIDLNKLIFIITRRPIEAETLGKTDLSDLKWLPVAVGSSDVLEELAKIMVNSLTYVRLQARAMEWQRQSHELKFLLSLGDIEASLARVDWLKKHPSLGLLITPEQEEFLAVSQKQANQRTDYFQGKIPDIFISYSSLDRSFVKDLGAALKRAELGIWVDHDNIPIATNWKKEVAEGIRAAHTFVFVISSHSLSSEPCGWELQQARRHGRRVIPICAHHDFEHESLKRAGLSAINYISFERQSFPEATGQLVKAIATDLRDVKIYNRLYSQAYDWSNHGRQQYLLLKQEQYREFKKWQQTRHKKSNGATTLQALHNLQLDYMAESQIALGRELAVKRSLEALGMALMIAVVGLTIGYSRALLGEIEALVASLRDKSGLDGVLTALRASKSLERNFLLAPISADLQLDARTALHQETLIARELNRLDGHERAAYSVAFSPDGEFIISTGQDTTVRVWNFSGSLMPPLTKHENEVLAVEYSSDGDFFVSGDADGVINLWSCRPTVSSRYRVVSETSRADSATDQDSPCQWIRTLPNGPSERIVRLSISPGSQYIAASSFDGNVYLWKRSSGPEPFQFMKKLPHNGPVFGLDFSPKDRILVSADTSGQVKIWPLEEKSEDAIPTPIDSLEIDDLVYDTRFSFDGKLVAIGGANGLLKVWNRDTGNVVDLPGHREGYVHVLFHPFERRLISADTEGIINLWRPEDLNRALNGSDGDPEEGFPKPIALLGHQGSITRIQFSANGNYLASASADDTIRLWLTEDGTLLDVMSGHEDEVLNLAFSPERGGQYGRSYLASSSRDGTIRLWQINNDVRPLKHENRLYDVSFHPDGKVLAASGRGRISLWRLQDYKLLGRVSVSEQKPLDILSVHYSPNGDLLAAGDAGGNITLWKHPVDQYQPSGSQTNQVEKKPYKQWKNTNSGTSNANNTTSPEIAVVRFHPNSQIIAAGSVDGTVRFWDTQGMLLGHQDIRRQDYGVTSLDFSREGKYLVVSTSPRLAENALATSHRSGSGQIDVYEVKVDEQTLQVSLSPVSTIDASTQGAHTEGILTVVINPANSNEFASGSEDGQIKIWDIEGHLIKTLSSHHGEAKNNNRNRITRVDYSKDGQLLVSSHEDGTIKFWNLSTGRMISSLKRHERQVAKVIFNPIDSTMLASAGFDAQVLIWTIPNKFQDHPLQKLVAKGCLSADKYLALEESGSDKSFRNKDEKDIRAYCLKNPIVKESLRNNHLARPIQDEH